MPIRSIVRYPDPRLAAPAAPVTGFDAALRALADDLVDTMRDAPAVGITGPHIGVASRIVVLHLQDDAGPAVYVNPEIVWRAPQSIVHDEGSVSMPGVAERITRAAAVRVRYRDLDGQERTEEAEGFRSVCHQHEIDQLDGIFWIERLSRLKRERVLARFAKLTRG
ncbi:peptide deformylase [Chitinasiproducens palmae]|uniref:Peptide deformylase-like n=1 Tax=Chitinasiproducens palmae TaxID=1770053 RepID=A0A1H2PTC9_9BURK|nr:peptide deformylase [Chitinasiproducens palmae]SDV50343.1 peptide deformylase [Chitinasiproducens palmae]